MATVKCDKVGKVFHDQQVKKVVALKSIDLQVNKGDFLAIAGPSGSGKSTLLNLIGGLERTTTGSITIDDTNLNSLNQSDLAQLRLRKMGFVFQAYNLIPVLSAIENVEFILMLQGVGQNQRQQRAKKMLSEVGLTREISRRPGELSGGQQQRVAVARAMVSNPALILADEPTANLDSKTGESLLELMKKLNQERQVTFIFSTHDKMIMDQAHRVVFLRDGQIINEKKNQN